MVIPNAPVARLNSCGHDPAAANPHAPNPAQDGVLGRAIAGNAASEAAVARIRASAVPPPYPDHGDPNDGLCMLGVVVDALNAISARLQATPGVVLVHGTVAAADLAGAAGSDRRWSVTLASGAVAVDDAAAARPICDIMLHQFSRVSALPLSQLDPPPAPPTPPPPHTSHTHTPCGVLYYAPTYVPDADWCLQSDVLTNLGGACHRGGASVAPDLVCRSRSGRRCRAAPGAGPSGALITPLPLAIFRVATWSCLSAHTPRRVPKQPVGRFPLSF